MIVGASKPPDQSKSVYLESLSKSISIYLDTYENVKLLGGINFKYNIFYSTKHVS